MRTQKNTLKEKITSIRPVSDFSVELFPTTPSNNQQKFFVVNRQGKRPYNEDRFICKNGIHKFYFKNHLKK